MSRVRPAELASVDELFPALPTAARALLNEQPLLLEFLLQLDRDLARREFATEEVSRLAKRWSEEVPRRRGAIVYLLRNFLQPELELDLLKPRAKRVATRIRHRGRRPG
jgi:hypothetical protein